jgi:hypothetical protein
MSAVRLGTIGMLKRKNMLDLTAVIAHLLTVIGSDDASAETGRAIVAAYNKAKSRLGSAEIATRLNLAEAELQLFEASLRDFAKRYDSIEGHELERTTEISALRLVSWLETLQNRGVAVSAPEFSELSVNEEVGRKQVRALELILRSLVSERFGSDLEQQLKTIIKPELVDKWRASGDPDDLLSGTTFSELSSLVINKDEFRYYEKLYSHSTYLNYLRDRRKTIQNFLDDVRRVRNVLAHNKSISDAQLQLLELYYEELTIPIQDAFDNGETSVDPSAYIDVSKEELQAYFVDLKQDIASVQDELADFRASVEGDLGVIKEDTAVIRETTAGVKSRTTVIAIGVVALLVLMGGSYFFLVGTQENTEAILVDTATIKQAATETNQAITGVQQSSERIEGNIDLIREGLEGFAQLGGLISEPSTPAALYHNSRIYRQRGELDLALETLKTLFEYEFIVADPIKDLVAMLRQKYGDSGVDAAIGMFVPKDKQILLAYAKLLISAPSSKDLEFWLSTDPLYLPAVPEIIRHNADQSWNLSRYKLVTELENRFMQSSQDPQMYYLDPVLATTAFETVKRSHEKTDWKFFENVKVSPVYFKSGVSPFLVSPHGGALRANYIEFTPVLEDVTPSNSFMIRFNPTGDFAGNLFIPGVNDLSAWIPFGDCQECRSSVFGSITGVQLDPLLFGDDEETFPAFDRDPERQARDPMICVSSAAAGNIYFDVKWVDSEGVTRERNDLRLCPELAAPAANLLVTNRGDSLAILEDQGWSRSELERTLTQRFEELSSVDPENALSRTAAEFRMFESEARHVMGIARKNDRINVVNLSVDKVLGATFHPLQKGVEMTELRLVDLETGDIVRPIANDTWELAEVSYGCRNSVSFWFCERIAHQVGNVWRIETPFEKFRLELEVGVYGLPETSAGVLSPISQEVYISNEINIGSNRLRN